MTDEDARVMGPDGTAAPNNRILVAPRLVVTTDKLKWRTEVRMWATSVELYAEGGDTRSKGMMSALGITLYHAVDESFRSKLDRAIAAGILKLRPAGNENPKKVQHEAVEAIIQIVAKDSVTDSIRRLVQMMRDIYACRRKATETPETFSRRFQGLALKYLNHCSSSSTEKDSQNFAMLLLENADIPSTVYSSIVTQLVSKANERGQANDDEICLATKSTLEGMKHHAQQSVMKYKNWRNSTSPQLPPIESDIILSNFELITNEIHKIIQHNECNRDTDRAKFSITLGDAADALADVKVDDVNTPTSTQPTRVQGTLLGKRYASTPHYGQNKSSRTHIPVGTGPKANSKCRSCNQIGHWWRDPICPKFSDNMRNESNRTTHRHDMTQHARIPYKPSWVGPSATDSKHVTNNDTAEILNDAQITKQDKKTLGSQTFW